ncbi:SH3 domain-containing protein [Streptococcus sp. SQ9-PEA]|uniref:SH3 domain-containing protein n=1 Tax=Streptococcus sciuri TaxID=2973939 RepID=A0ABT2F6Y7_9STRE|nr:SH3 domain-containing protein [Streptococcus sciuri]
MTTEKSEWENTKVANNTQSQSAESISATSPTAGIIKEATIIVTYPDGSTDEVKVNYTVAETDADKNEPTVRTQTVRPGQVPTADSFITNKDSLPAGTTFSYKGEVSEEATVTSSESTSTIAQPNTSETVTEPVKSTEEAPAIATTATQQSASEAVKVSEKTPTKLDTSETAKVPEKSEKTPITTTKADFSKKDSKSTGESAKNKVVKEVITGPELPDRGRYTFTAKTAVYTTPSTNSSVSFYFDKGNAVNYDKVLDAENARWISYISYSGIRRYAKVGELTKVLEETTESENAKDKKTTPVLAARGTYTFTDTAEVRNEAKLSSPVQFEFRKGESVNYDKVLTSDDYNWISYISYSGVRRYVALNKIEKATVETPQKEVAQSTAPVEVESVAATIPTSGIYRFTERVAIKNEPKSSSPAVYYYNAGDSVRYDKTLIADNQRWISYISYSGSRRYVPIGEVKSAPTTQVDLPASGTYTFNKRVNVKNDPKATSSVVFYLDKGYTLNYDRLLTADGRRWMSYISRSGQRRYVDLD